MSESKLDNFIKFLVANSNQLRTGFTLLTGAQPGTLIGLASIPDILMPPISSCTMLQKPTDSNDDYKRKTIHKEEMFK